MLVGGQALAFWLAYFRIDVDGGPRFYDGEFVGADVLQNVVGLNAGAVRKRAVEVTHPRDPSLRFLVKDPVDCLVSRFENLRRIPAEQNGTGAWQAAKAIAVCRAYIGELIRSGGERKAIKVATALFRLAGSAAGLQAHAKYGLDILEGVPLDAFSSESFRREQARRSLAAIGKAREDLAGAKRR